MRHGRCVSDTVRFWNFNFIFNIKHRENFGATLLLHWYASPLFQEGMIKTVKIKENDVQVRYVTLKETDCKSVAVEEFFLLRCLNFHMIFFYLWKSRHFETAFMKIDNQEIQFYVRWCQFWCCVYNLTFKKCKY